MPASTDSASSRRVPIPRRARDYFVYTCTGDIESFHSVDELRLTSDSLLLYGGGVLLASIDRRELLFAAKGLIEPFQN